MKLNLMIFSVMLVATPMVLADKLIQLDNGSTCYIANNGVTFGCKPVANSSPPSYIPDIKPSSDEDDGQKHSEGYYRCLKTGSNPDSCRRMYDD